MKATRLRRVVVITGTPGVGKTAVSRELATRLHALYVDIGDMVKREKLTTGYDKKRQTSIVNTHKLTKKLRQIIKEQKTEVLIDGHYAASVVPRSKIAKVFVLRCHPKQLKERMEKHGFRGNKIWENLEAEILDVCLLDAVADVEAEKICEIDTTNQTIADSAEEILSVYNGQKECTHGNIDWIGTLEKERTLDEYLQQFSKRLP